MNHYNIYVLRFTFILFGIIIILPPDSRADELDKMRTVLRELYSPINCEQLSREVLQITQKVYEESLMCKAEPKPALQTPSDNVNTLVTNLIEEFKSHF